MLDRVPAQVKAAATAAMKDQPREAAKEATRQAVHDAFFLLKLVFEINAQAEEKTRTEGPRSVAAACEMRAISIEQELTTYESAADGTNYAERQADSLARARAWLTELYVYGDAGTLLERRYLDGQPSLFPARVAAWTWMAGCPERRRRGHRRGARSSG